MVVRHTMFVPGVLKQNFCQSPYLICRLALAAQGDFRLWFLRGPGRRGLLRIGKGSRHAEAAEKSDERRFPKRIIGLLRAYRACREID